MTHRMAAIAMAIIGATSVAHANPLPPEPVPFRFERTVTESGTVLEAGTVYNAVFTSTLAPIEFRFPSMLNAMPAARAFALVEPASEIALLAALAGLALLRRRGRAQRVGQRTRG